VPENLSGCILFKQFYIHIYGYCRLWGEKYEIFIWKILFKILR